MSISRRGRAWTGYWEKKYFPPAPIIPVLESISENLSISAVTLDVYTFKAIVTEIFNITDSVLLSFSELVSDQISWAESSIITLFKPVSISENISVEDDVNTLISVLNTITEILDLTDLPNGFFKLEVTETITLTDSLLQIASVINLVLENIIDSDLTSNSYINILALSDDIDISASDSNFTIFNQLLESNLIINIGDLNEPKSYIAYLMSPETFSVTTYNNYDFTGSCKFNDDYLFVNESGLYKYGGTLDNTSFIQSEIETAALSFGTSNFKQVPNFYMGLSNSNKLVLKVSVDGDVISYYQLNKKTDNLQTQKISIGKGLIGRYFQFELITSDNTQFQLSDLEFYPIELKRKL